MRPPICEVCNERFDPKEGALVTCVADESSFAFAERAKQPGFVGHPPNKGWFCADHEARAREFSTSLSLPGVVASIRAQDDDA